MEWYRLEEPAPGVTAVIDVNGGWFRSNSVIIDMGGYTLVVDTQYNEPRARALMEIIESKGYPDRIMVVNTHHHGDHAWGNHVFNAPSIMHKGAAQMVEILIGIAPDIYKPFFPWLNFEGSRYTKPWIIVEGPIRLQCEKRTAIIKPYTPAHTIGDIVVELPEDRVLIAGDLVFNQVTPLALDGTVTGWARILERLEQEYRDWTIIPGHGPLASTETIHKMKQYFRHLQGSVQYLLNQGTPRDPLQLAEKATPGPLMKWKDPERLVLNIARLLMDLDGKPPGYPVDNLPELAMKMQKYREKLEKQA